MEKKYPGESIPWTDTGMVGSQETDGSINAWLFALMVGSTSISTIDTFS
jgi:hypothetical protein